MSKIFDFLTRWGEKTYSADQEYFALFSQSGESIFNKTTPETKVSVDINDMNAWYQL